MTSKLNMPLILTFILIAIFFAAAVSTSSDTYWHMAVGREVAQTKHIPTQDNFVYGSNPTNYPSTEWLAGLIFYWVSQTFGIYGMPILRTTLGLIVIILFYKTLALITKNVWLICTSCLVVGYVLGYRLFDRPESFSFVFMALINFFFLQYFLKNKISNYIFLLPVIFLAWINIHAYFVLSIPFLFLFLIIAAVRKDKKSMVSILAVTILVFLSLFTGYKTILDFASSSSKVYAVHIGEFDTLWQRLMITEGFDLFHQISLDIYIYFLIFLFLIAGIFPFILKWKKNLLNIIAGLFYLAYLLTPVKIIRLLSPAVLIGFPYTLNLINPYIKKYQNITLYIYKFVFAVFFVILTISIFNKDILGMRLFHNIVYQYDGSSGPGKPFRVTNHSWTQIFPKGAEIIINDYLNSKRIFTVNYWGNYFIWTVPKAKVFSDSMIAYKTPADWDAEDSLIYGTGDWQKNLEKYNIDTVVNNQPNVFIQNATPVYKLNNWKLVYVNDSFAVYARNDVIKEEPVNLSNIHLNLSDFQKFNPEDEKPAIEQLENLKKFENKNAFAREQLVFYYLQKDIQKAQQLAIESRGLIPNNPYFSLYLAQIAADNKQCSQAKEYAKEAKDKSFGNFSIEIPLQKLYQQCPM